MVDLGSLYDNSYKEVADGLRSVRISQVLAQNMAQVYSISKVSVQLTGRNPQLHQSPLRHQNRPCKGAHLDEQTGAQSKKMGGKRFSQSPQRIWSPIHKWESDPHARTTIRVSVASSQHSLLGQCGQGDRWLMPPPQHTVTFTHRSAPAK